VTTHPHDQVVGLAKVVVAIAHRQAVDAAASDAGWQLQAPGADRIEWQLHEVHGYGVTLSAWQPTVVRTSLSGRVETRAVMVESVRQSAMRL
jgi:hypothetical protein